MAHYDLGQVEAFDADLEALKTAYPDKAACFIAQIHAWR